MVDGGAHVEGVLFDELHTTRSIELAPRAVERDRLKPKSTDKEIENVVTINAHKGSKNFVLSLFR